MKRFHVLLAAVLLAGCATEYQLGTTLPPELRDVYVPTVVNETDEPTVHQTASQRLLREIQRDGTLNLISNPEEASTVLEVAITGFTLEPITYQADDKHTGREYRATLRARVLFRNRGTGQVLYQGTISAEEEFDATGDLTSAKRRMMPQVCKELSERIVDACISLW